MASRQLDAEFIAIRTGEAASGPHEKSVLARQLGSLAGALVSPIADAALTLTDDHHGLILDFTNAGAVTVTVPDSLRPDFFCGISQGGTGQVTVAASGTATINEPNAQFKTSSRYVLLSLVAFGRSAFRLFGSTTA